jgi:hypothetical protein
VGEGTILTLDPTNLVFVQDFITQGMSDNWEIFEKTLDEGNTRTMKEYISDAEGLVHYVKYLQTKTWHRLAGDESESDSESGEFVLGESGSEVVKLYDYHVTYCS